VPKTDIPEVFARETGGGRVVISPGTSIGLLGGSLGGPLESCCATLSIGRRTSRARCRSKVPEFWTSPLWRQKDSLTLHMVNLTNPMMNERAAPRIHSACRRNRSPSRCPKADRARQVKLLVSGKSVHVQETGGRIRLTVPSILDHESRGGGSVSSAAREARSFRHGCPIVRAFAAHDRSAPACARGPSDSRPVRPVPRITRWQGIAIATRLVAHARATARTAGACR